METYEILRIGFFVCLGVAVLFLILSILLFFMFDIRGVISSRSGKTRQKTIKEMEETNSSTGRLMQKKQSQKNTTGNLDKHKVTVKKGVVVAPDQMDGSKITEKIKITEEIGKPAEEAAQTAPLGAETAETAPLGADAAETAVLGADDAQTAVLGADAAETAPLGADAAQTAVLGADAAQTAVLGEDPARTADLEAVTQRFGEAETAVLVQSASVPAVDGVRFEITKKMVVCDTQEIVE